MAKQAATVSWWGLLWGNKALLVAVFAALAATLLSPADSGALVTRAREAARGPLPAPAFAHFVERREMAAIVEAATSGAKYVIVDGGNGVGKSVAVKAASSRLSSAGRAVLTCVCEPGDTAGAVLRRLFGLDSPPASLLAAALGAVTRLAPSHPPSVAEIRRALLARSGPEAVLVVEMAERLDAAELKSLLDFAKELADERRGRFVIVVSPTGKLEAVRRFGSFSRAKVVHVGSLGEAEALAFLGLVGCGPERASALFALIGGHLPHLLSGAARDYCLGATTLPELEAELSAGLSAQLNAVDDALEGALSASQSGIVLFEDIDARLRSRWTACAGLCSVLSSSAPRPAADVIGRLASEHLVVASLERGKYVGSKLARAVAAARCQCGGSGDAAQDA